ncbi:fumarylacetoacetase [Exilibacterium tricleocarpae]|uniref:fumarylacetoacetase n=1 Tax=Exilibacterium tricleocarpae TaxID=2591008 RepID=A0A545TNT1_9GAMM|nr:fumarylacetoacetase [Exilibacterium tricleocarpae]TQV78848.1 fumarylacetoacetase [Exilibacterium tricleocarpae]
MTQLNETHAPRLTSWVTSANNNSDFPIQNLPFAVFRRSGSDEVMRGGVAIGDQVLDMAAAAGAGVFEGEALAAAKAAAQSSLNALMALGPDTNAALRLALSRALRSGAAAQSSLANCLVPQAAVEYDLPCRIGDYTDFYTSIHHATAIGSLFRPDSPLLPNYKWVPIGYHGRASTIGVSGQTFPRPVGQTKAPDANEPSFGPCKRLDYELEMGIFVGRGTALGERIDIDAAEAHVFGLCLLNDWSARDIQAWEYQPLGPFLAKNFASTISPWIITLEALAPYRSAFERPAEDPQPLPYLTSDFNTAHGNIDIQLECLIETAQMRAAGEAPARLSSSSFRHSYWTAAQMLTHHSVTGCAMNPGDLLGSGTQSGPQPEEAGSILELTGGGKRPITLPNGEQRTFLEDGDSIVMRGYCQRDGAARIGFGEVVATVLPARV